MSNKTATPTETLADVTPTEEWEDIQVGLGEEWDVESDGPITGLFMGMETLDVPDANNPGEIRATNAYRIEVQGSDETPNRFVWGSYNLDLAMQEIQVGDKVRISFVGRNSFKGKDGRPQTVKTYRVQRAKIAAQ